MPAKTVEMDFKDLPDALKDAIIDGILDILQEDIGSIPTHPLFDEAVRLIDAEVPSHKFNDIVGATKPVVVSMADACGSVEGLQQWFNDGGLDLQEQGYRMCELLVLFGFLMGQAKTLVDFNSVMDEVESQLHPTQATESKVDPFDLPIAPYQDSSTKSD